MNWQQLRNEAAANSRFEFSHDFLAPEAVRRLPIELAQRSNSSHYRSSKYGGACSRRTQFKGLSAPSATLRPLRAPAAARAGNDGNSILNRFSSPFKSCNKYFWAASCWKSRLVPLASNVRDYGALHSYVSAEIRLKSSRTETCKTECQSEIARRASRTFSSCCLSGH